MNAAGGIEIGIGEGLADADHKVMVHAHTRRDDIVIHRAAV